MPGHSAIHKEAAVEQRVREAGLRRQRELEIKKATEAASKKEKEDRGLTKVQIKPATPK
tara:strand:+ start:777 stop:953 length:177 start_codon:yes stop_codon:yes gene_type:complete